MDLFKVFKSQFAAAKKIQDRWRKARLTPAMVAPLPIVVAASQVPRASPSVGDVPEAPLPMLQVLPVITKCDAPQTAPISIDEPSPEDEIEDLRLRLSEALKELAELRKAS